MDVISLSQFIKKTISNRRRLVEECLLEKGVTSMEQYRQLMGELDALAYVDQELTGLLEKQEQIDV
tara:strand:+ start:371 stop:568 length:198 start_codon:yes stop_codon:yes gene_type:complete